MDVKLAFPDDEARATFLSASRQEMYNALSLFHDHVRHTLSLMFTIMTIVAGIFGILPRFAEVQAQPFNEFRLTGGLLLCLLFPFGIISIMIIARYYKLYVAALVYATELHESVGLSSHAWFEDILRELKSVENDAQKRKLIMKRAYGWPHSWILYSILIALIGTAGVVGGIVAFVSI